MKHILGYARRAINDFDMIKTGDKIAVGLSGGKDSLLTLLTLSELRRFYPEKFELIAITLDMGMDGFDTTYLKKICMENNIEYFVEKTHPYQDLYKIRTYKNVYHKTYTNSL